MGVQGLWELLAPVGRRVSVETLAGKRLAIDASIWMVQFLKAMRDERGEMVRNAHVLGFFRRICKLLFLRTRPVFVFDGGTPALKRRTVASRRRHRENAQAKIRKTAEKLLLNHLKAKRLEELAQEIKKNTSNGIKDKENAANKGKQVVSDENQHETKTEWAQADETLDEMLAASLAAEEEELNGNKMAFAGDVQRGKEEEDDEDEDDEMILPVTSSNIDPSVLASLPPSMQLDLLVQMRENQIAENRQKYQKLKKTPTKFSELQIQSYLKTVAFRREIDEVQKCAAGRGLEGVQSSRIASEANREFIFSSSFTGDKQALSARAVEKNGPAVDQSMKRTINLDSVKRSLFTSQAQSPAESSADKITNDFGNDVETYRDENGRVRVSRVRGLGIRMTRDLQRNLDLMRECEDCNSGDMHTDLQSKHTKEVSSATGIPRSNSLDDASISNKGNGRNSGIKTGTSTQDGNQCSNDLSVHVSNAPIEISFLEDDSGVKETDDDLFMRLVSGTSTSAFSLASFPSDVSRNESEFGCDWEEGIIGENDESWQINQKSKGTLSLAEDNSCEEYEEEWEEGDCNVLNGVTICEPEQERIISRGIVEEEAEIQEALRRSLQDIEIQKGSTESAAGANLESSTDGQNPVATTHDLTLEECNGATQLSPLGHPDRSTLPCPTVDVRQIIAINFDEKTIAAEETTKKPTVSSELDDSSVKIPHCDEDGLEHQVSHEEQCMDISEQVGFAPSCSIISKEDFDDNGLNFDFNTVGNTHEAIPNAYADHTESFELSCSMRRKDETIYAKQCALTDEKVVNGDTVQEEVMNNHSNTIPTKEVSPYKGESTTHEELDNDNYVSEVNLEEEISILRQERRILGDEQRKLERNAEAVSSEMFAECQELLQMFGLPYIIAPMEAEAQCAYMEMANLVDGVVTDDSDVFLFGARNVYKNIFDDRKYVETYFMKDIESELGLNRETLMRMALLLGSDYTEGVSGIGIVNAIEVVRAFPEEDGLLKFREWIESPDPSILGKLDSHSGSNSKKKTVKSSNKDDGIRDTAKGTPYEEDVSTGREDQQYLDDSEHVKETFMTKHRNVSKNWHLPSSFPSKAVITAYTSPQVDESTEPFTWAKPDLLLLRKLCWERFGWDNKKSDELLVPVLKEYNKHETQLRIEAFYTFNERFAKIRSKRIKKAVKGITGKCSTELINDLGEASTSRKKRGCDPSVKEVHKSEKRSMDNSTREVSKKPRRQKVENQNMQSENRSGDIFTPCAGRKSDRSGLAANLRGGRGRGRGRKGRGRGKEEELLDESTDSNSSTDCGDEDGREKDIQVPEAMSELRRSKRQKKHVEYAEDDVNVEADIRDSDDAAKGEGSVEQRGSIRTEDVSNRKECGNRHQSPDVSLSGDCLLSGGGFCTVENEAQGDDDALHPPACSFDDNGDSKDYLQRGGGFCMDEDEVPVETADLNGRLVKKDEKPDESTTEPVGGSSQAMEHMESLEREEAKAANLGLRAMPYLRKKRRKI